MNKIVLILLVMKREYLPRSEFLEMVNVVNL